MDLWRRATLRKLYSDRYTFDGIARLYGVSRTWVWRIAHGNLPKRPIVRHRDGRIEDIQRALVERDAIRDELATLTGVAIAERHGVSTTTVTTTEALRRIDEEMAA